MSELFEIIIDKLAEERAAEILDEYLENLILEKVAKDSVGSTTAAEPTPEAVAEAVKLRINAKKALRKTASLDDLIEERFQEKLAGPRAEAVGSAAKHFFGGMKAPFAKGSRPDTLKEVGGYFKPGLYKEHVSMLKNQGLTGTQAHARAIGERMPAVGGAATVGSLATYGGYKALGGGKNKNR